MIDSEAINNYILQQVIEMLKLTSQWASKPMQIYIVNEESEWITDQVHIEVMILKDSQKLTFDVLNSIKYDVILKMLWLHKRTQELIESAKELYIMIDVYEISEQSEMSLSEHKSWDHEILLLNDKQSKWMSLYSMSEDQLKKVRTYQWESQREIHKIIKVIDRIPDSVCIKKEWHKATMCQLQTTQQDN
jgi:hypothetical protein